MNFLSFLALHADFLRILNNTVQAHLLHAFAEHSSFALQYIVESPTFTVHQQIQSPFLDMSKEEDRAKAQREYTMFQEEPITYERLILPSHPTFNIEQYNRVESVKMMSVFRRPEPPSQTADNMNAVGKLPASLNLTDNPPRLLIIQTATALASHIALIYLLKKMWYGSEPIDPIAIENSQFRPPFGVRMHRFMKVRDTPEDCLPKEFIAYGSMHVSISFKIYFPDKFG